MEVCADQWICARSARMIIQYHGDACIRITGKNGPQEFIVLLDPYDSKTTGLKPLRPSSVDVVCSTTGALPPFAEGPSIIRGPGEYEVKGVSVTGIPCEGRTIYRIIADGISIGHLGNTSAALDDAMIDRLGELDVLILPIGGKEVLSAKLASGMVEQIEPRVVIPIQYAIHGAMLPYESPAAFCKEMGCSETGAEEKLKLTKSDLPSDEMWVRMLLVS